MSDYGDSLRLACFVSSKLDYYDKDTVNEMSEMFGVDVVDDFFNAYENTFGISLSHLRKYLI